MIDIQEVFMVASALLRASTMTAATMYKAIVTDPAATPIEKARAERHLALVQQSLASLDAGEQAELDIAVPPKPPS